MKLTKWIIILIFILIGLLGLVQSSSSKPLNQQLDNWIYFPIISKTEYRQAENVEMIGHRWSTFYATIYFVQDNFLYSTGGRPYDNAGLFSVLDISNPLSPKILSNIVINSESGGLRFVDGNYAYLTGQSGLHIWDISDYEHMVRVGEYDSDPVIDIEIKGNLAYLITDSDLHVIDISDKVHPSEYVILPLDSNPKAVSVDGDYIYVVRAHTCHPPPFPGCAGGGLTILDNTNPSNPVEMGYLEGDFGNIVIRGEYAYIYSPESLRIIDISDPSSPIQVGVLGIGAIREIKLEGKYAFIARGFHGLSVVDISDPYNPYEVFLLPPPSGLSPDSLSVSGNYLYLGEFDGLWIVDISAPTSPVDVTTIETHDELHGTSAGDIAVTITEDHLLTVDVSTPAEPVIVGETEISWRHEIFGGIGIESRVVVSENYAYITHSNDLNIIDISNPISLTLISNFDIFGMGDSRGYPAVVDDFVLLCYTEGWRIIDVSDPTNPTEVNFIDEYPCRDLAVIANYAFIAGNGLRIYDISNPLDPFIIGSIFTEINGFEHVRVVGEYAFLEAYGVGLHIIKVANPNLPSAEGFYPFTSGIEDLFVEDDFVYLGLADRNIYILDISNPSQPRIAGFYKIPIGIPTGLFVDNKIIYVVGDTRGFIVLQFVDPENQAE